MSQRFPMRLDWWWRPLLLVGGAVPGNSYVEVDDLSIRLRYALLFDYAILRAQITRAEQRSWPFWRGIGWRTDFRRQLGLIGSTEGVVELELSQPLRYWGFMRCTRVAVSLEQPQLFLAALGLAEH